MEEDLPDHPAHERNGEKHSHDRESRRRHGKTDFVCALFGGPVMVFSHLHVAHNVLAHNDGVVAQTHEPLDGLHAATEFRLFALFEFGELFGAEEFGDHVARHDLAVADGGEQIINAPETVIVGDALEVAVGSVQEFLG